MVSVVVAAAVVVAAVVVAAMIVAAAVVVAAAAVVVTVARFSLRILRLFGSVGGFSVLSSIVINSFINSDGSFA